MLSNEHILEKEKRGDRIEHRQSLEVLLGSERFRELEGYLLDIPDFAIVSTSTKRVLAWIEVTTIRSLNPHFDTLLDKTSEIDCHLSTDGIPAKYYEPAYLVYVIADSAAYDANGILRKDSHDPIPKIMLSRVTPALAVNPRYDKQFHEMKYHMPLSYFIEDTPELPKLIRELRGMMNK